jgi:tetratricopeptide (TPR) repeat protein
MTLVPNHVIETYIQRVTELSQSAQRLPTATELERIATELGIGPAEIQAAQKQAQDHYTRAQGYLKLKYWQDAIGELQEAIAFNPSQPDLLIALGQAHLGRWQQRHQPEDREQLHLCVRQCLALQPDSQEALNLLAALQQALQRRQHRRWQFGLFFSAVFLGGLGMIAAQGGLPWMVQEREALEQKRQQEILNLRIRQDNLSRDLYQLRQGQQQLIEQQRRQAQQLTDRLEKLEQELKKQKQTPPRLVIPLPQVEPPTSP